jgi:hypothetical protein
MKIFLIFIFGGFSLQSFAGVKDFSDDFAAAAVVQNHHYRLRFKPNVDTNNTLVQYRPNTKSLSGYQVSYWGLTVAYLRSNKLDDREKELKGKTSYEDLRAALFLGKKNQWTLFGYYNRFKGLYIDNSTEVDSSLSETDPKIQRRDISVFNTGASLMYIFKPDKFSAAAAFMQSAQQTSSGGSWLAMLSIDGTLFSGDQALIPTQVRSHFGSDANLIEGNFNTVSLAGGYGHSFVANNFFLTLTALVGYGIQYRSYKLEGQPSISGDSGTSKFSLGLSLGYNGKNFYAGASSIMDEVTYETESIEISNQLSSSRFFLGFRL